ncbi:keto-hydroxyglutarate-aldolase/keto-deoxy-phosphogluconate aldolase [compost metagenome]
MPTGGVDLENMGQWIQAGALAVGIGSNLTAPAKQGSYDKITELAFAYVAKYRLVRS